MKTILATTLLICTAAYAQDPPAVSSGTLVANFNSDPSTMDFVKGTNELTAWRAANDASIVLAGVGAQTENITFVQSELGGHGALVVNDGSGHKPPPYGFNWNRTVQRHDFLGGALQSRPKRFNW